MKPEAVEQAKERFLKRRKLWIILLLRPTIKTLKRRGLIFLIATSAIYSKLEQGAKGNTKSEPWFGRKKRERKNDPLLCYLHHARNSSEHGIERVVGQTPPNNDGYGRALKFNERIGPFQFKAHDPKTGELKAEGDAVFAGPTLKPIKVTDARFGDEFDPPSLHFGKEILFSDFADGLAKQAIVYFRSLVIEAESLL